MNTGVSNAVCLDAMSYLLGVTLSGGSCSLHYQSQQLLGLFNELVCFLLPV